MRAFSILAALALPLALVSGKKSSANKYDQFQSQSSVKLTDKTYRDLTTGSRDYAVAALLTAMDPRVGCTACQGFAPEWDVLSKSWRKGDKKDEGRLVFGVLDFAEGRETFQSLMLTTAPVILLFNPTTGPNASPNTQPQRLDFTTGPLSAEQVQAWLARHVSGGPTPPVVRPVNYGKIVFVTTSVLGVFTFIAVAAPYIMPILGNRNLWAAISLILVLLFTSGHMFNQIRKVPYITGDGKGGITYFAGGFQNQFGLETQIIAAIYGFLSFAAISLGMKVPRIVNPKAQQFAVLAWSVILFGTYSFLMSIFRIKNGGYPFWLPPF